jgi:hypothetical protein
MDTHPDHPTSEPDPDEGLTDTDPWDEAADRMRALGARLKDQYRDMVGDEGPSEGDVRDAFRTLGSAFERVLDAVSSAFRDPDVREQTKQAAASFVSALGATFDELGDELRRATRRGEHEAEPADEEAWPEEE